jgi:hypothetical protein
MNVFQTVYAALKRRSSTWVAGNTNNGRSLHFAVAGASAPVGMTAIEIKGKVKSNVKGGGQERPPHTYTLTGCGLVANNCLSTYCKIPPLA